MSIRVYLTRSGLRAGNRDSPERPPNNARDAPGRSPAGARAAPERRARGDHAEGRRRGARAAPDRNDSTSETTARAITATAPDFITRVASHRASSCGSWQGISSWREAPYSIMAPSFQTPKPTELRATPHDSRAAQRVEGANFARMQRDTELHAEPGEREIDRE